MNEPFKTSREQVLALLHDLCESAFAPGSVTMLALMAGALTTVVLSASSATADGLPAGAVATFSFREAQLDTLLGMGVEASDCAMAAFRELLEQLARAVSDRSALMRPVYTRLEAASSWQGRDPAASF